MLAFLEAKKETFTTVLKEKAVYSSNVASIKLNFRNLTVFPQIQTRRKMNYFYHQPQLVLRAAKNMARAESSSDGKIGFEDWVTEFKDSKSHLMLSAA